MKKILTASVLAVIGATSAASAADMATKAPMYKAAPAVVSDWTGFYIGGNLGGAWSSTRFDAIPGTGDHFLLPGQSVSTGNSNGNFVGGGQIGYNWQYQQIVFGLEGTYSAANIRNSTVQFADQVFPGEAVTLSSRIDQYGTIVGRLGFTPTNNWLLYGKGGYAAGRVSTFPMDFVAPGGAPLHFSYASAWHNGWTGGFGVEYKWAQNWVVGVEYDYLRLNSKNQSNPTIFTAAGAPAFYSENVRADISTITARLSYLFHAGPVVAKY